MPPLPSPQIQNFLSAAHVNPAVFTLRPDYRALLLVVENITPGPSNSLSEALLVEAETSARASLSQHGNLTSIPQIAAWREAYKSFGAKPARTRNSLEALTRRVEGSGAGLSRVNRLTDIYNAISVKFQIPLGGEDLSKYQGPPRLLRATGEETFETTAAGETVVEHPDKGEVVWCDERSVTCRRWNWRQSPRTALTDETTDALFILDGLEKGGCGKEELGQAADELVRRLEELGKGLKVMRVVLGKDTAQAGT